MPFLYNHRRRHSWPYTGPEKRPLPIIKVSAPEDDEKEQHGLEEHFLTALSPEDLFDDDAFDDDVSAGIVRSPPVTSPSHHHLWGHFHGPTSELKGHNGGKDQQAEEEYHLSGSEEPTSSGAHTLRRIIRPRLDKARSLFAVPTTTPAGERVFVPYVVEDFSQQQKQQEELRRVDSRAVAVRAATGAWGGRERRRGRSAVLAAQRNHRRCHSEQPRAWREPSASLWTLREE